MVHFRKLIPLSIFFAAFLVQAQTPRAEWRMDECEWTGVAGEVVDNQGNGYDGTAVNGATTAAAKLCYGGAFYGTSGYVTVPNSDFRFRNRMAVAAWVKWDITPSSGQNYANIISINSTLQTDVGQFWLQHDNNNQHFQFAVSTTRGRFFVNSTTRPVQGVWYHVVGVFNRNQLRIYVNGVLENTNSIGRNANIVSYSPQYVLDIGRWAYAGFPRAFSGQIDEVKVYSRSLGNSAVNQLYNRENSGRNYDNSVRTCPLCPPVAEYRMDECAWTGAPGEIADSSGNGYNGTAYNTATTTSGGVLCQAGTFNRTGTSDYAVLDHRAIDGATDFTFMGWFKTPKAGNQVLISGAASANANNWLLWHSQANRIMTFLLGSTVTYTLPYAINDDQWHHIAWVRSGSTESLYLDGSLVSSFTRSTNPVSVDSGGLIIGQEQDCVGGCFDASQVFVGEIDELRFDDAALSATQIQNIYTNQQSGFNADGSPRTCAVCGPDMDLRMDECAWDGTAGEVTDSTGHGHDGTAQGGAVTDGTAPILCRNGVLTGTGYVTIDTPFAIGTAWTATMWCQFPLSTAGHNTVGSFGNVFVVGSLQGTGDLALLYDSGGSNLRWMVYDHNGTIASADFPDGLSGWHQLVFVGHGSGTTDLYLDGSLLNTVNRRSAGNLMYIGTSSDDPTGQTIGCMVDEYKLYLTDLTSTDIASLYADESAGLSWDGLPRTCPSCTPVAEYRMDECAWDGSGGEVLDSSGNGYNGTAVGNATTTADAAICRAGNFNTAGTTGQYVTLPAASIDGVQDFSYATWFKLEDSATHTLLSAATSANPNAMLLFLWNSTTLGTYINRPGGTAINQYTISDVADGNWHQVVWTRYGNQETLYLDGAMVGTAPTDGNPVTVNSLILGQEQDCLGGCFDDNQALRGQQDEVKFWRRALKASEVAAIYANESTGVNWDGAARTCPPCALIAYFEVQHDGSAIVCYPEVIHLVARDATGGVVTGYTGTVSLSTSTGNGTWYTTYGGLTNNDPPQGTFSDPTPDDGQATYTFAIGDQGEVTLFLRDTHAETLQITASDGIFTSAGHNSGNLVFRPSGFAIKDAGGADIPNQVSGHPFTVTITAIGQDPQSGQCTALDYSGQKTIDAILVYDDPSSGSTALVLDGNNVSSSGTSIQLNFVNSVATVSANYADAGRIWFRLTDSAEGITGDSAMFVVKPWAYAVSADGNPGAVDATGSPYVAAGDSFTLNVHAVVWDSADDTNNDLVPDSGADLTDNAVTPNYTSAVTVTHSLTAPSGGATGTLSGIPGSVTNGVLAAANAVFTEVGVITVSATTGDYLGAGAVSGTSGPIGRFTPKYIDVTAFNQNPGCTAGANPFTYSEQPYAVDLTLTAKNTGGTPTQNYTGAFVKLGASGLSMAVNTGSGSLTVGSIPNPLPFTNGVALFSVTGNRYGWGAAHDPESVILQLTGSDADGIPVGTDASGSPGLSNPVSFRYGRLQVIDNFGPSDRDLTLTIQAQYYSGGDYLPNTDDSCTTYAQSDIQLSNWQGGLASGETGILSFTTVTAGNGSVTLSAPGLGNEGSVDLTLTAPSWFVFDPGTASFGIYRGDDRFISWQEIQK